MSHINSIQKLVVRIPMPEGIDDIGPKDDIYIPLEICSESNLFYGNTNKQVRNLVTRLPALGQDRFMMAMTKLAVDCAGGWVRSRGRLLKPETYIASWRVAMENAVTLETALKLFPEAMKISIRGENLPASTVATIVDLNANHGHIVVNTDNTAAVMVDLSAENGIEILAHTMQRHYLLWQNTYCSDEFGAHTETLRRLSKEA